MTIKLNKVMREEIADDLTRHLAAKVEEIDKEAGSLATLLYNELFSEEQQRLLVSLPEGWMVTFDCFMVEHPVEGHRRVTLKMPFRQRRPYEFDTHPDLVNLISEAPKFYSVYLDWINRYADARAQLRSAHAKAMVVLSSVTTVNKLLEVWPESRASVERCVSGAQSLGTAVSVPITELNTLLELPEEQAA